MIWPVQHVSQIHVSKGFPNVPRPFTILRTIWRPNLELTHESATADRFCSPAEGHFPLTNQRLVFGAPSWQQSFAGIICACLLDDTGCEVHGEIIRKTMISNPVRFCVRRNVDAATLCPAQQMQGNGFPVMHTSRHILLWQQSA